jgi:prepilin-type N-terminal cleavage/methylation domain-containing protein
MSELLRRLRSRLRDERGFSLTEVLVATLIGSIVFVVVLDLVDASQGATSRVEGRVDSTQRGRTAMEQVTQRLRSQTCVAVTGGANGFAQEPPIAAGDNNEVTFYADLGDGSDFQPELRRIYVSGNDLLEDVSDGNSTANGAGWTFPNANSGTTHVILDRVAPVNDSAGNPLPYFRYFAYDTSPAAQPSVALSTPLSDADRARVVKVEVAFKALPSTDNDGLSDTVFDNSVITRFGDPSSSDPNNRGPVCD